MQFVTRRPSGGSSGGKPLGRVAGSDDPAAMKKRSVVISGHRTSVSLENAFWNALKTTAAESGQTVNQLVTEIDQGRSGNLSSAIRVFILLRARSR